MQTKVAFLMPLAIALGGLCFLSYGLSAQVANAGNRNGPGQRGIMDFRLRLLEQMDLNETEKGAARETLRVKADARVRLSEKLRALSEISQNKDASESEIKQRLDAFNAAKVQYDKSLAEADHALMKKLSIRALAKLTVAGFLENGITSGTVPSLLR